MTRRPILRLPTAALVVSTVTAAAALPAAEGAAAFLAPGQVYLDLNSCGPETKAELARTVAPSGADFCEGTLMGLVAGEADRAPILLCGPEAAWTAAALVRPGLTATDLGRELGAASTVKLLRSVFVKGLEALLDETLTAAEAAGVREPVLPSLASTFNDGNFRHLAEHHLGRLRAHGPRRAEELREAARLLRSLGVPPHLAEAAVLHRANAGGTER